MHMQNIFLAPGWFLGYDILFETLFIIVASLVSWYSFKMHSLTGERKPKLFGIAFLLIMAAYFMQMAMNSIFFFYLKDLLFTPYQAYLIIIAYAALIYGYTYLLLLGQITLVYMTFNVKDIKIFLLIAIMALLILIFGIEKLLLFYIMSATISFFIALHFAKNHLKNKNKSSLIVFLGFLSIFIAYIFFTFSIQEDIFYFIGHFAKLTGFALILSNLLTIARKEREILKASKKSTR